MPATFSASTCISLNNTSSGQQFDIYLDSDYTSTPFSSATITEITTCPFVIVVPTGTTSLGFKDTTFNYCLDIPIQNNDICSNCNLTLTNYSSTTISTISCGNLIGTCGNINDYVINWYGPDDTTTLSFTSGAGSFFTVGMTQHPFLGVNSIPKPEGVYTPIIEKIKLSGITFSNTGGTNNVLFSGNCLPTTNVLPLTCTVKTNTATSFPYSAYTNFSSFSSASGGGIPVPVNTTYEISANTKYIAWAFSGSSVPDRLTIEFSGTSYPVIGIEDIVVGSSLTSSNYNPSTYPKSASTAYFFNKISCLTGFTVNNGDKLKVIVTPSTSQTDWSLYMTCLDDFNCNDCLSTQNYKIIGSTITGITASCDTTQVKFSISGCSAVNSDYLTYFNVIMTDFPADNYNVWSPNTIIARFTSNLYYGSYSCSRAAASIPDPICTTDSTPTSYSKTYLNDGSGRGVFGFTGSSTFISTYYNSINNAFSGLSPYNSIWTGNTNPYSSGYYRFYKLKIPSFTAQNGCVDPKYTTDLYIHHTSQIATGITGSNYYLNITANTITDYNIFTSCQLNCNSNENIIVNNINNTSTGATTNYGTTGRTFTSGVYYATPIYGLEYFITGNTTNTNDPILGYFRTPDWSFNTYPFSGNPSTILPQFSGTVCNYNSTGINTTQYNSFINSQYRYYYDVRLTNPLNVSDFDIWASPITNFSYSGAPSTIYYELAYRYSGGNIAYSSSTYIIG